MTLSNQPPMDEAGLFLNDGGCDKKASAGVLGASLGLFQAASQSKQQRNQ